MIANSIGDILTIYGSFDKIRGELTKKKNQFVFRNKDILFKSTYYYDKSGVIKREDSIKNVSKKDIELSTLLSKFTFNGGEYEVYTQYSEHITENMGSWQPLITGVFGMSDEVRSSQDVNPFVAIYNLQNDRGMAFHILADSMFEYRVRKDCEFLSPRLVTVELGIKSENFSYKLSPSEEIKMPTILYYEFSSKKDMDAYKLHRYCISNNPLKSVPVIYNSWMNKFDYMDYDVMHEELLKAKELGCDYFTVDAGWFGKTQLWWEVVGDWKESTDYAMKGRMKEFSDEVRKKGLKFGLWFEIERAAATSQNVKDHPEYYIKDGEFYFVDFSNAEACDFIFNILKSNIDKYKIEFIKFDLNSPFTFDKKRHSFIDYYKGYAHFIGKIRENYPSIHLECCASGGGRMTLSNLKYFDSFWMSDNHGIYEQLKIFKSTMIRMPSNRLEHWATIRSHEKFTPVYPYDENGTEKIFLSADAGWNRVEEASLDFIKNAMVGGPFGISCDLSSVSKETLSNLAKYIKDYKKEKDFWEKSECHILCDTSSVTAIQFNDIDFNKVKIYVFTEMAHQNNITLYPWCDKNCKFSLNGKVYTKSELIKDGISIPCYGLRNTSFVELRKEK